MFDEICKLLLEDSEIRADYWPLRSPQKAMDSTQTEIEQPRVHKPPSSPLGSRLVVLKQVPIGYGRWLAARGAARSWCHTSPPSPSPLKIPEGQPKYQGKVNNSANSTSGTHVTKTIVASFALAICGNAIALGVHSVYPHSCSKPYKPYSFSSQYDVDSYNASVDRYRRCIEEFVEDQQQAIDDHKRAARDAIEEWNSFVRANQ